MKQQLAEELATIKSQGLLREPKIISSCPDKDIIISGKHFINFSSNNYLGLAGNDQVKQAAIKAIEKYGCGGTSSRLVAGTLDLHRELELKLAKFKNTQSCIVFPTGFHTNLGVISALIQEGDCIIMDRLNHASLWDAAKISRARIFVYKHCDIFDLDKILHRTKNYRRRLIVTDSVFSMDGDFAPLNNIVALAQKHKAWTMIDEAHATGIFGKRGTGLAEHFGVEDKVDIIMGTLSKAFGSQGGFVCGSDELINYLINKSRSFIYTTALAPACAAAALKALEIIKREPQRRKNLLESAQYLRDKIKSCGFDTLNSSSQIVPLLIGLVNETQSLSQKLYEQGIFAPAIRPPTVPEGKCRLRFSLMSQHTKHDLDKVIKVINE